MNKNTQITILAAGFVIVVILGFLLWSKLSFSKETPAAPSPAPKVVTPEVKKIDLSKQPEWVQKLMVKATRGKSSNGLENVTFNVSGLPKGLVSNVTYVVQYQTTNKGAQGALASKPVEINGAEKFFKTIDLGTCSTKSCVYHEGVTSVDLELDFTISSGEQNSWSNTIELK